MKKFVFLIHPRDIQDVGRRFPGNILGETWGMRLLPKKFTEWILPKLRGRSGFTICSRFKVFDSDIMGYIVSVLLTGKQMLTLPRKVVRQRILDAVLFAQDKLGAELIGLGALIAPVTDAGQWIVKQPGVRIKVTHGDSYAVAVAEEGIEKIIHLCGIERNQIKIAIVGAYGLIGSALAEVLAKRYHLILVGRSRIELERLKGNLGTGAGNNIFISTDLMAIYDADIVITATSHPEALIQPEYLKYGAIIYDIAQPMNVSPSLLNKRPDVIKADGCYTYLNGIDLKFDMGPPYGTTFACCAETIMQALEGENNHRVGKIDLAYIEVTRKWAKKYGFSHAPFSCFGRSIPVERFLEIANQAR